MDEVQTHTTSAVPDCGPYADWKTHLQMCQLHEVDVTAPAPSDDAPAADGETTTGGDKNGADWLKAYGAAAGVLGLTIMVYRASQ